jgi:hypothetical protein
MKHGTISAASNLFPVHPMLSLAIDMEPDVLSLQSFADPGHQSRRGGKAVGRHTANVSVIVYISLSLIAYTLYYFIT